MRETEDIKAVPAAIDDIGDKSRRLNESLKALSGEGLERLSRAIAQGPSTAGAGMGGSRKPAGDIVNDELGKLLRREVAAGLAQLFGASPGREKAGGGIFGSSAVGGGVQVIVHNNTPAAVSVQESGGAMDQKQLEITIDQMVANSLIRGRQTSGVLRSLFGLAPSLMGR